MVRLCLGLLLAGSLFCNELAPKKATLEKLFVKKSSMASNIVGDEVPIEHIVIQTGDNGFPTLEAVKQLMEKDFFRHEKQGSVVVREANEGSYSDAIYSVGIKQDGIFRAVFFLKISKSVKGKTIDRLSQIQRGRIGRIGLEKHYNDSNPIIRKSLPIIVWLEKIYKYKDKNGHEHIIELSHAAHGEQVSTIINTKSLEQISSCGYYVGRSLGFFQQVFIKDINKNDPKKWLTVAHNDFHWGNMFFDEKTEKVYFIDNETMSENYSIFVDVIYLMRDFTIKNNDNLNILNFIFSFIHGYLGAYPKSKRCMIALNLEKYLLNETIVKKIKSFTDEFVMLELERDIVGFYKYFMNQYVQFLKSNIMKFDTCGVYDINRAVYKEDYSYVESVSSDVVNSSDLFGMTPLFWALEKNDLKMLRLLNSKGINPLKESHLFPRGVLEYFVLQDNDKALKNAIDTLSLSNNILESLLVKAALYGSINTVKTLLSVGVNINAEVNLYYGAKDSFVTPLYVAAILAHVSVVKELLQNKDINVNFLDRMDRNPLLKLAQNVEYFSDRKKNDANDVAKMLIDSGADITLKGRSGKTAFDIMPSWRSYQESIETHVPKAKNRKVNNQELLVDALKLAMLV